MRQWLDGLRQDVAFAVRTLSKDRRFTIAAVLALGLAIGVNNSVFAVINTALIRDLPFEEPDRLVTAGLSDGRGIGGLTYRVFLDWRGTTRALEEIGARVNTVMVVSEPDRAPERFRGTYITANTFRALRVAPLIGRDFTADDDKAGAPPVLMLSYAAWHGRYAGDPTVVGRPVRVNNVATTIVGVMPPGFGWPFNNELWTPLSVAPFLATPRRDSTSLYVYGRLAPGADLASARAEIEVVAARSGEKPSGPRESAMRPTVILMRDDYRIRSPFLPVFMGAVALVMLIACANLANLLLARATARAREMAVRASLGATRWRIVRQVLIECLLIAALAAVLGGVLSIYGARTIAVAFDPMEPGAAPGSTRPFWINTSFDGTMYAFVALLAVFATLACGLVPALQASRTNVAALVKDGGRGSAGGSRTRWWSSAFVTAEVALTLMLLASTGLLWRSFFERYNRDLVIDTSNLAVMSLGLPAQKYPTPEARAAFYQQLEERLAAVPSVATATLANVAPFSPFGATRELTIAGSPPQASAEGTARPAVTLVQTGARYFETIPIDVLRGRALTDADRLPGQEGAVVDEQFSARYFPDGSVLGQRIRLSTPNAPVVAAGSPDPWITIVGVVRALPQFGPQELRRPLVYVPIGALPLQGPGTIIARARDMRAAVAALREEVRALDADLALYAIETVDDAVARARYPVRLVSTWFSIIAGIALVLACVGLYALTAYGVSQRTQEIGLRMALGAHASQVLWLFLRQAVAQIAVGLALGIAGALATTRFLRMYLEDVNPRDPLTMAIVALVLIAVAVTASLLPARRATRVDPMVALRCE